MPITPWDVAGTLGLLLLLGAYALNAWGRLSREGLTYAWLNFVGAALLAAYSWVLGVWIFVALEGVWALIGFHAMWRAWRRGDRTFRLLTSD